MSFSKPAQSKQTTEVRSFDDEALRDSKQQVSVRASERLDMMGYKDELKRNLGLTTILGLSFSIIAAPFGISLGMSFGLTNGGPVTVLWGWAVVSLISLAMSSSLAEICSKYPSAGGVYIWTAYISPRKYSTLLSWIVGWVSLVANLTLCLSINFGGAQLIMAAISIFRDDEWAPPAWATILTFWACMLIAAVVNAFGVRGNYLERLNTASMYWSAASVVAIMITLLALAREGRRSAAFAFGGWENASGWPDGWSFFVGLLQASYTLTGYGTVSSLTEECMDPEREVPRAMVGSVLAASLTGFMYIIPILFVLPDIQTLLSAAAGQPISVLFHLVTGSTGGGFGLLFLLIGIFFFAGVGSLTVALRCLWSFSRDGAVPGSRWLSKVNKTLELPLNSLIATTVVVGLLGLIYLGSTAAFSAFTGVATICLGLSYAIPIGLSLAQARRPVADAPFPLGRMGVFLNATTCAWIALSTVIFCMPTAIAGLNAKTMNYASVVFTFFFAVSAVWYWVWGYAHYIGPAGLVHDDVTSADHVATMDENVADQGPDLTPQVESTDKDGL